MSGTWERHIDPRNPTTELARRALTATGKERGREGKRSSLSSDSSRMSLHASVESASPRKKTKASKRSQSHRSIKFKKAKRSRRSTAEQTTKRSKTPPPPADAFGEGMTGMGLPVGGDSDCCRLCGNWMDYAEDDVYICMVCG